MNTVDDEAFTWRELPDYALRIEHPQLRQPISLVVDDPTPGYNPAYFHSGFRNGPMLVPRELVDRFADLVEATGMRGKFSVIPYPFGLGRVDRGVEGVSDADVRYFLDVVRSRIAPYLDLTPEALTHWNALDLQTGQLLPFFEHVWSRSQDRTTLTPYMARALEIMNAVDMPGSGVTSPWDFGDGVEDDYAEAILAAQQQVNGRSFCWYFLQLDATSRHVPPRLTILRPDAGEAVVSIVTCDAYDFGRAVWSGGSPDPDMLITADGRGGRLAAVLDAGGPAVFHTHWQTMFSQGSESGLHALGEVARRLQEHYGDQVTWTTCTDLAHYAAATAALQIERGNSEAGQIDIVTDAPFSTARFTLSMSCGRPVRSVDIDGRRLAPAATRDGFVEDTYLVEGERLFLCWNLMGRQTLHVDCA